jgi:trk system potassium uptake protein TrkA
VGAGEMGYHLARRLSAENQDVVLVDRNEERIMWVQDNLDVRAVQGRGSSPAVLKQAGVETASLLIAVTDSDETNLLACYVGGMLNRVMRKVARLREDDFASAEELLDDKHLGVDLAINPDVETVQKLVRVLGIPAATDAMDFAEGRIKLFGIRPAPDSPLLGRSLLELRAAYPEDKFLIPAIFRDSEAIIPRGADTLKSQDTVYLMAEAEFVPRLLEVCGLRSKPLRRFMIYGGTNIAVRTALDLEAQGITNIRLIASNRDRCEAIAAELTHTMALYAESVDEDLLREEAVSEVDAFLAMTEEDERNALTAVLAKKMGAFRVAALTNKVEYHRLVSALGVDIALNARLVGVSRILQHIRRGKVLSVSMLPGEGVEVLECVAMETSDIVGRPLRKVHFPKGALVGAVERDKKMLIPDGATELIPGDRIIVFARKDAVRKVEKLLTVKLEYFS